MNPSRFFSHRIAHLLATVCPLLALLSAATVCLMAQEPPAGDVFSTQGCETPGREPSCPAVRWGWGDCPGQPRVACDWCYGKEGVFAYVRRTNRSFELSSACEHLAELPPGDVIWSTGDPEVAERMEEAGGSCRPLQGVILCQGVRTDDFRRAQPGAGRPAPADPQAAAAEELRRQWESPAEQGRRVAYGRVTHGGDTLHGVRIRGGVRVAVASPARTVPQTVAGAVQGGQVEGGVTGTFFSPRTFQPAGPVVAGGRVVAAQRPAHGNRFVPRSCLVCGPSGCSIRDLPVDPSPAALQARLADMVRSGVTDGLGGLGRLLAAGEVRIDPAQELADLGSPARDARVVAGIDRDGAVVLLVQQGDDRARRGATARELARVLQGLGVTDAVLLDGGGSTQISIPGRGVLYQAEPRPQPTAILF
jgi:hypothetical protein